MRLSPELEQTLSTVADVASAASDPWWIIGSGAVALHGASVGHIRDVDLMMSVTNARQLIVRLDLQPVPDADHALFRSELFATWREPPLPVEIFGGFHLSSNGAWRPVEFETREAIRVGGRSLFVPSARELHALLLSFGRAKDLERAALLAGR